jgi:hypothetical protein
MKSEESMTRRDCPYNPNQQLNGVIALLTQECGGNIHDKGIVEVKSKSTFNDDPDYSPRNVADLTTEQAFVSRSETGQWISWDFRERRVIVTGYAIQAYRHSHPRGWKIQGSNDETNWVTLHSQEGNENLKTAFAIASWDVENTQAFRIIRLSQTQNNHYDGEYLELSAFEIFGTLLE